MKITFLHFYSNPIVAEVLPPLGLFVVGGLLIYFFKKINNKKKKKDAAIATA